MVCWTACLLYQTTCVTYIAAKMRTDTRLGFLSVVVFIFVLVVAVEGIQPPRIINGRGRNQFSSICFAHFSTPCSLVGMVSLVDQLLEELATDAVDDVIARIGRGEYNTMRNLWPSVIASNGTYIASGQIRTTGTRRPEDLDGSSMPGLSVNQVASLEGGIRVLDLWDRMQQGAEDDGHYQYVGWDNFHAVGVPPYAVPRIGYARFVDTRRGKLLVTAAVSNKPYRDTLVDQPCSADYDALCSISYTRRVLGRTMAAMITAGNQAEIDEVFAKVVWKDFNEYSFYPFIAQLGDGFGYMHAHGGNRALTGNSVSGIIDGIPALGKIIKGMELYGNFSAAAEAGGEWTAYDWTSFGEVFDIFEKVTFVAGVQRFGVRYLIAVGYSHVITPLVSGPRCTTCNADYNYPYLPSTHTHFPLPSVLPPPPCPPFPLSPLLPSCAFSSPYRDETAGSLRPGRNRTQEAPCLGQIALSRCCFFRWLLTTGSSTGARGRPRWRRWGGRRRCS